MAIYQTIVKDITKGIDNGQFKRGQKLPSIRKLSETYHCSKDTVQKAMLELKYLHKIYAIEKSGYYILEDKDFQEQEAQLNPDDFALLPYQDFRTCLNESLVGRENYLFNYYHQQEGLEELIVSLQHLLVDYDVYAKKEQLVITSGSQQALHILTQLCHSQKNAKILLEDPTYDRMQALLDKQDLPYETIERDFSGIDLKKLENYFATGNFRFFYTIPRLHNPLGSSYTLEQKKEIVRLAEQYQVYIIEDDYLADFDSTRQVPLHYLDTDAFCLMI
ncbi:aminotransferase-like domain-containing protein [Streptococcus sp. X13SY08]|uniref:aminotransferase-like domain-containing protein n=1 Tax=Streptococcus sp. X13SY08 TaxID=1676616 RepID=UPI00069D7BD1